MSAARRGGVCRHGGGGHPVLCAHAAAATAARLATREWGRRPRRPGRGRARPRPPPLPATAEADAPPRTASRAEGVGAGWCPPPPSPPRRQSATPHGRLAEDPRVGPALLVGLGGGGTLARPPRPGRRFGTDGGGGGCRGSSRGQRRPYMPGRGAAPKKISASSAAGAAPGGGACRGVVRQQIGSGRTRDCGEEEPPLGRGRGGGWVPSHQLARDLSDDASGRQAAPPTKWMATKRRASAIDGYCPPRTAGGPFRGLL